MEKVSRVLGPSRKRELAERARTFSKRPSRSSTGTSAAALAAVPSTCQSRPTACTLRITASFGRALEIAARAPNTVLRAGACRATSATSASSRARAASAASPGAAASRRDATSPCSASSVRPRQRSADTAASVSPAAAATHAIRERFRTGEDLIVAVTFRTTEPVSRPIFGVALFRADGVYVGEVVVLGMVKGTVFDSGSATLEASTIAAKFWELYGARAATSTNVS